MPILKFGLFFAVAFIAYTGWSPVKTLSIFSPKQAFAINMSGTVYDTTETAPLLSALAIKMAVGATTSYSTTTLASNGTFSFTGVTQPATGTVVTLWLNTDAGTTKGSLVFKYGTTCAGGTTSCTGLSLYQGSVIIGPDYNNTANTITNSDLAACDNNSGAGCADADIGFTSEPAGDGLKGDYYDGMNFDTFVSTHTDTTVNFNPADSLGVSYANSSDGNTFSVRWTGYVKADYSETYTFYATSDDGERLWVNSQQLINAWVDRGPTESSGTIALTAGQWYPITYEFYENGGGAAAYLSYSSASVSKAIIPQTNLSTTGNGNLSLTWATNQLRIADANAKFAPGGNVTTQALNIAGTYTGGSETLALTGNGIPLYVSGTFTPTGNTVTYSGTGGVTVASTTFANLTFSNSSGTDTAGGNLTATTLTMSTGILDMTSYTLTVTTAPTTGTIKTASTANPPFTAGKTWGTVEYTGTGGQYIPAGTYTTITLPDYYYTVTALGDFTVNTALNIRLSTLDMSTYQLLGAFTPSGGALRTSSTANPAFPAGKTWDTNIQIWRQAGGQYIPGGTFSQLWFYNDLGTDTAVGDITVNSWLVSGSCGATLDMSTYQLTTSYATPFTCGTIKTANTSATPISSGLTWGTVEFTATGGGQSVPAGTYTTLLFDNTSNTNTAVGDITATNLTTTSGGTLNMSTYALAVTTPTNGGTLKTANTTAAPISSGLTWGGTVEYNSASGQTIVANNYNNLTSSSSGGRTLASSGTVGIAGTFTPGSNTYTITGSTIDFNGTGAQTVTAFNYNNLTVSGDKNGNVLTLASGTIGIAGAFVATATNMYYWGTAGNTISMTSTSAQNVPEISYNNLSLVPAGTVAYSLGTGGIINIGGNLTVGNGTNALTLSAATYDTTVYVIGDTTIAAGATYTVGNLPATFTNSLTVNGTLSGSGTGTIQASGNVTGSGIVNLTGNSFMQWIAGDQTFGSSSGTNGWTFSTLWFGNSTISPHEITMNGGTGTITVSDVLKVGWQFNSANTTLTVGSRIFDVTGRVFIDSNGILSAPASAAFTVGGNFSNAPSGTFIHNNGTITFNGTGTSTISSAADITFGSISVTTAGKGIKFQKHTANVPTFTIAGTFTVTGAENNLVSIVSDTSASQALIKFNGAQSSITYAYIKDMGCGSGSADATLDATSVDGTNNGTCWVFQEGGSTITVSGTVYDTTETAPLLSALAMKMAVGASTSYTATLSASDGTFSFTSVTAPSVGAVVTVWLNTDSGTEKGSLVFKYGSGCTGGNCTGLSLYQNRVTIDNKYTGSIANSNLTACDNDSGSACNDSDIGFTSAPLALTFTTNVLKIPTGITFAPGGNVTVQKIDIAGTYTGGSETLALTGSGTPLSITGTFTQNSNTVSFRATSGTTTIPSLTYNNLDVAPASGGGIFVMGGSASAGSGGGTGGTSSTTPVVTNWYNSSWGYRKAITIDHSKVSTASGTALTDFPVLVSLPSDAGLAAHAQSSGNDILFTSADGTTKLNHEIETYASSTGQLISWVRVPTLATSTDTTLYMYYGNASASNQATTTGVWDSNYKGVYHLAETSGTTVVDSTGTNNAIKDGTSNPAPYSNGKIGGGQSFASGDKISLATQLNIGAVHTISFWYWHTGGDYTEGYGPRSSDAASLTQLHWQPEAPSGSYWHYAASWALGVDANGVTKGSWHYFWARRNGANASVGQDDTELASVSDTGNDFLVDRIAQFLGYADEIHISTAYRSIDWIKTEYNNQNSTSTFYTLRSEESYSNNTKWYSNYSYKKTITVDHTKVPTTVNSFPMLVSFTDTDLKTNAQSTGNDIAFYDSSSNQIDHEIEKYDNATGELIAWVKAPTLSSTTDTSIYMAYGNATIASQQNATKVWDANYKGVWHLPDGTTLTANDSTGVNNGSLVNAPSPVPGQVDGGASFSSGSSKRIDLGTNSSLDLSRNLTYSAWINISSAGQSAIISKYTGGPYLRTYSGKLNFLKSQVEDLGSSNTSLSPGNWYYVAATVSSGGTATVTFYLNGSPDGSFTTATTFSSIQGAYIGGEAGYEYWNGIIDEARVSSVARSEGWIKTEYNNQSSTSTFYTVGAQTAANSGSSGSSTGTTTATSTGASWYNSAWGYRKAITIDHSKVSTASGTALTDFPVLVSLPSDTSLSSHALSTGNDILFTSADGTTKLNHEIETYASSTGQLISWVKVPALATSTDTTLYMYYGNSGASNQATTTGVWDSNYKGVWHLNDTGDTLADSTSGGHTATKVDSGHPYSTAGKIANGMSTDPIDDTHNVTFSDSNNLGVNVTLSAWVNYHTNYGSVSLLRDLTHEYSIQINTNGPPTYINYATNATGVTPLGAVDEWHYYTVRRIGTAADFYVDGTHVSTQQTLGTNNDQTLNSGDYLIGNWYSDTKVDEIRASNITRSPDWIATEYNNQSSTSTFYSLRSEESYTNSQTKWYSNYTYKKTITVDHTKVPATVNSFPMLVSFTDTDLKTNAQTSGNDIAFYDSNNNQIDHEIEKYTSSTGELVAWVKAPTLSSTTDTSIYMAYGNATIASQQNAVKVWDTNYKGVWHMNETSGTAILDSTNNNNDATKGGASTPAPGTGKIGGGQEASATWSSDAITFDNSTNLGKNITLSFWSKQPRGWGSRQTFMGSSYYSRFGVYYPNDDTTDSTMMTETYNAYVTQGPVGSLDSWHYYAVRRTGTSVSFYMDGALLGTTQTLGANEDHQLTAADKLLYFVNSGGVVDEMRASNITRSAGWIKTEYNNQNSTSTFYSVGAQTAPPTSGSSGSSDPVVENWYNSSWGYRKAITIDHSKVSTASSTVLTDFPVLVSLPSDTSLSAHALSTGNDILFTSADGTTKLNHEIETYASSTGQLISWVKIPTLATSTDTTLYMYYGNASAANQATTTGVWDSNYRIVQHMKETSGTIYDSTSYGNNGTNVNSATSATEKIGNGYEVTGAGNGRIQTAYNSNWADSTNGFSMQAWIRMDSSGDYKGLFAVGGWGLTLNLFRTSDGYGGGYITTTGNGTLSWVHSGTLLPFDSAYHLYTMTYDRAAGTVNLYYDGTLLDSAWVTVTGDIVFDSLDVAVGSFAYENRSFTGAVDEFRVSSIGRSADWVKTEYNNQSSTSTFYSLRSEESYSNNTKWYSNYSYKKTITVDHTKVPTTVNSFPMLVSFTDTDLKTNAQSTGNDIAFYDSNANQIDHQIEKYDNSTGELVAWVKAPTLSSTTDTSIYMAYGNATIASQQNATKVWDANYKGVYHLKEDPAGGAPQFLDSTSNTNNLSVGGSGSTIASVSGISGNAYSQTKGGQYNGNNLTSANNTGMGTGNQTLSMWYKPNVFFTGTDYGNVRIGGRNWGTYPNSVFQFFQKDNGQLFSSWGGDGHNSADGFTMVTGNWHYLVMNTDGTNVRVYVNGEIDTTTLQAEAIYDNAGLVIGQVGHYGSSGAYDEVRISSTDRSAGWIKTEYNNQNSTSTFYSVGAQTAPPTSGSSGSSDPVVENWYNSSWGYRKAITIDHSKVGTVSGTALSDFPVLVSLPSDTSLSAHALSTGNDILFTSADGTTKLNHEIEKYTSGTGALVSWVKVPTLATSTDTTLYMYYGNASAANQATTTGVWDTNYKGVWHMGETSGTAILDSTSNNNNATKDGASNPAPFSNGKIGGGQQYTADDDITFSSSTNLGLNVTYSTWVKEISDYTGMSMFIGGGNYDAGQIWISWQYDPHVTSIHMATWNQEASIFLDPGVAAVGDYWHLYTITRAGASFKFYLDGVQMGTTQTVAYGDNDQWLMDRLFHASPSNMVEGYVDEMRASNSVRSADWVATEYNNQSSTSTFYTLRSEESYSNNTKWYSNFDHRKSITVDHTKVPATVNSFPMLVSVTDTDLKDNAQSSGNDIAFYDSNANQIDHQIEKYTSSTGELIAWVKAPTLSSTTDTSIYMAYGNATIANQQNATKVWDTNYKGVWHLNEDPTGGVPQLLDSTSNNLDMTVSGATTPSNTAGPFGGNGVAFPYTNAYAAGNTASSVSGLGIGQYDPYTVSIWFKLDSHPGDDYGSVALLDSYTPALGFSGSGSNVVQQRDMFVTNGTTPLVDGTWYYAVASWEGNPGGSTMRVYLNGVQEGSNSYGTMGGDASIARLIAGPRYSAVTYMDEYRVSKFKRSAGWIATEYNNQSSTSTFYQIGTQETPSAGTTGTEEEAAAEPLTVSGNFTMSGGTPTIDANTKGMSLTVTGNMTIGSGVTFLAPGSASFTLSGNFANSGTFTHNNGTFTVNPTTVSTISGNSTTFYNFSSGSAGKTIQFGTSGTPTFTFAGAFSLNGTQGNNIILQSDSAGTQWMMNLTTDKIANVSYVSIKDTGCVDGSRYLTLDDPTITNLGNNCYKIIFWTSRGGGGGGGVSTVPRAEGGDGGGGAQQTPGAVVADSYGESNQVEENYTLNNVLYGSAFIVTQSFTAVGGTLDAVKFYIFKSGDASGNAVAKLYTHSGTFGASSEPTGSALATSNTLNISSLTGSLQLTTFTFSDANRISLSNGTYYVVSFECSGCTGDEYAGVDTSSPTHSGNSAVYNGTWSLYPSIDLIFYLYEIPVDNSGGGGTPPADQGDGGQQGGGGGDQTGGGGDSGGGGGASP